MIITWSQVIFTFPVPPEKLKLSGYSLHGNVADVYSWHCSNNVCATVAADGTVTAHRAGKAVTITCKAEDGSGKKATVKILVESGRIG